MDRLLWCHERWGTENSDGKDFINLKPGCLAAAWDHTKSGSPLRKLLADGFYEFGDHRNDSLRALSKDVLVDVAGLMRDQNDYIYKDWKKLCNYHEHAEAGEKASCKVKVKMDWDREEESDDE